MNDLDHVSKVVGTKQTLKAVKDGKVLKVILAKDTDDRLKKQIIASCDAYEVDLAEISSKRELGKAVGIDRSAAVIALLKEDHPSH